MSIDLEKSALTEPPGNPRQCWCLAGWR